MNWFPDPVSNWFSNFLPTAQRDEVPPPANMRHEREYNHQYGGTSSQLRAENDRLCRRLGEQRMLIREHAYTITDMQRALHDAHTESTQLHLRLQRQEADLLRKLEQEKAQRRKEFYAHRHQEANLWERLKQEQAQRSKEVFEYKHREAKFLEKLEQEKAHRSKEVSAYKHMILKSTELHHYKTDEDICSAWDNLFNDIQSWAFKVNRTMKPDVRFPKQTLWLATYMPLWHSKQTPNYKLNIIVATVAALIEKVFRECGVFGLSSFTPFHGLSEMAQSFKDVKDNAEYKKWLMTTHELLQETHAQQLAEARTATAHAMLQETKGDLNNLCSMQLTETFQQELINIYETALDVLRLLHFHPATFRIEMLQARSSKGPGLRHVDARYMDDITGQDDSDLAQCAVSGSVFPAVFKLRGEDGNKISEITVCKAKVLAATPDQLR